MNARFPARSVYSGIQLYNCAVKTDKCILEDDECEREKPDERTKVIK